MRTITRALAALDAWWPERKLRPAKLPSWQVAGGRFRLTVQESWELARWRVEHGWDEVELMGLFARPGQRSVQARLRMRLQGHYPDYRWVPVALEIGAETMAIPT